MSKRQKRWTTHPRRRLLFFFISRSALFRAADPATTWLTARPVCVRSSPTGGADAEPRWILPRGIPRPGQRGADSSGGLVA